MGIKGERTLTQLEWYTVTYRGMLAYSGTALLLLIAAVGFWFYRFHYAPKANAEAAIEKASERLGQARPLADAEKLRELVERAESALGDAKREFSDREYKDARFAALHSTDLSSQALELAKGNTANARMVRFYRLEGDVRVKHAGEFSWESAAPGTSLNIGDQVKTSSSSSAQLIYFDGTVTTIEPGSLLEIRDLYEDPVTKVRRVKQKLNFGEVQSSTTDSNVRGSYYELTTEKVSARAERGGEFRVKFDRKKKTTVIDNFKGQIEVASQGRRESLFAGERIRAKSDGRLVNKEALPGVPRLLAPADQRVFLIDKPAERKITLTWEEQPAAVKYHLIISDKPLFTDPLYDDYRENDRALLEVDPGAYHWKVAAINAAGVRGPFSEPRGFRVTSDKVMDRGDQEPPSLQVNEFVTIGMMVIINGYVEPGSTLWVDSEKIDVQDDGRFYAVVRLRREGENIVKLRAQDTAGNETVQARSALVEIF